MPRPTPQALLAALCVAGLLGCASQDELSVERAPLPILADSSAPKAAPNLQLPGAEFLNPVADVTEPVAADVDKAPFQKKGKKKSEVKLPPGWHSDYAKARAVAKQTGKPMLVLFH